jgi:hypothetical protein
LSSEEFPSKSRKQSIDGVRLHPRFKHYNYSFSRKKNEHVAEIEIKKDWINKITKDSSLEMIDTV